MCEFCLTNGFKLTGKANWLLPIHLYAFNALIFSVNAGTIWNKSPATP